MTTHHPDTKAGQRQKDEVRAYMREFGSITQFDAFVDLGIMRLGARIHDLKDDGYNIADRFIAVPRRRRPGSARVKQYWLADMGEPA